MRMKKLVVATALASVAMFGRAGDSAPFVLDNATTPSGGSVVLPWNAGWIGGNANATVVITDNGREVKRATGAGEFTLSVSCGDHQLEYSTFISGVKQSETYMVEAELPHDAVETKAAKAATYAAAGWTHEVRCSRCNAVLEASTAIPALGGASSPETCLVTFEGYSREVMLVGTPVGTLPELWDDGWWTARNGGTRISASTIVTGDVTYYPNYDGIYDGYDNECHSETIDGNTWEYFVHKTEAWVWCVWSRNSQITVPSSLGGKPVTRLGGDDDTWDGCFLGSRGLTSITIPESVKSIGRFTFEGCSALTNITILGSVKSIGGGAFYGCSALTRITIPDSVTNIGWSAFYGCSALRSISLPDSVNSIGDWAFEGCSSLSSVRMPSGKVDVGDGAFLGCTSLESDEFVIVKDVLYQYVGESTHVSIPAGVKKIGRNAFTPLGLEKKGEWVWDDIEDMDYDFDVVVEGSYRGPEIVTIPNSVTGICDSAFEWCSGLRSIAIPDSVKTIGSGAFRDCRSLANVTLPRGKVDVCNDAFLGCVSLAKNNFIIVRDVLCQYVGEGAFVSIPSGVKKIGAMAFRMAERKVWDDEWAGYVPGNVACSYRGPERITIPNGVTSIGECAFEGCRELTSVAIPNGLTNIGWSAFEGCGALTSVTIPNGITSIDYCTFASCSALRNVTIPDSVNTIEMYAFGGCGSLTNVYIPDRVVHIDESAFEWCGNLAEVYAARPLQPLLEHGNVFGNEQEYEEWGEVLNVPHITYRDVADWGLWQYEKNVNDMKVGAQDGKIELSFKVEDGVAQGFPNYLTPVLVVRARDTITGKTVTSVESALCGDTDYAEGEHRIVWDMAEQGVAINGSKVVFTVSYICESPNLWTVCSGDSEPVEMGTVYTFFTGYKMTVNVKLKGYTAKGLPSGLSYDSKKGTVSGAAKKATAAEGVTVTFTKKGKPAVKVIVVVRKEVVSAGCEDLDGVTFAAGMYRSGTIPLQLSTESGVKSVAVTGLPAGMKFDAKKRVITGFPTKGGDYTVTIKLTGKTGVSKTVKLTVHVDALPTSATGTFHGFAATESGKTLGAFTLTAASSGALTAKVVGANKTYSFSKSGWDSAEGGVYVAELATKVGDRLVLHVDSAAAWDANQATGTLTPATGDAAAVSAQRRAFGKTWRFVATGDAQSGWTLAYAEPSAAANITVSLAADGVTTLAGKLGTYTVSASGYANVGSFKDGALIADFAPIVTVGKGKTAKKLQFVVLADLWFDSANAPDGDVGSARIEQ